MIAAVSNTSQEKKAGDRESIPYPGLRPFEEWESHRFFGRESQVDELLLRLERGQFVAVVGVSGSGKSSLVRAGLVPALHAGRLPTLQRGWRVAILRPGNQPIRNLAEALAEAGIASLPAPDYPIPTATLADVALHQSGRGLVDVAGSTLAAEGANAFNALVVVDQFEEIFRYRREGSTEAKHFVQLLIEAARQSDVPLYVVLTMRSDFLGECAFFRGLLELINDGQYVVQRMTRTEQRAAIEKPAQTLGVTIRPRLVNRLLNDLGDDPDRLPVLQHAVRRAWMRANREGVPPRDLDLKDYMEIGTMQDAIGIHADDAYRDLPMYQRSLAEKIFRALTDGSSNPRGERRPLLLSQLTAVVGATAAEVVEVIDIFRAPDRCFLTPPARKVLEPDKDIIDLSHESLIWLWPRLRDEWMPAEAADARTFRQLKEWKRSDGLLPEGLVQRAEEWREKVRPTAAWAALHLPELADAKAVEKKLAACLALIDESRRELRLRARKILWLKWTAFLAFVLAGVGFALLLGKRNVEQSNAIQVLAPAAGAMVESSKAAVTEAERELAKLITAIEGAAKDAPPDKTALEEFQKRATAAAGAVVAFDNLAKSVRGAADTSHDPNLTALVDKLDEQAREAREKVAAFQKPPAAVDAATKALTIRLAYAEYFLNGLIGWKGMDQPTVKSRANDISAATAHVNAIDAISAAALVLGFDRTTDRELSKRIADVKATLDATYRLQNSEIKPGMIETWKPEQAFQRVRLGGKINRVRFSPAPVETPRLAAACDDHQVWFWRNGGIPKGYQVATHEINDIAFSPNGDAAAASNGSTVRILRLSSAGPPENAGTDIPNAAFERHSDAVTDVEFSHGGERLASASADRTVRVFDSRDLRQLYFTSPPLPGIVTSIAFHPRDNLLVSGCDDGGVRLHTIDNPAVQLLGKFGAPARRPEFSANGKFVVAASGDKTARVWPIVESREIVNISHEAPVTHATFRPVIDGENYLFATTATNGEVRLVRFNNEKSATPNSRSEILKPSHSGAALFATWSSDGRWLATVGGGEVILWAWTDNSLVARLRMAELPPATSRAEFSPNAQLLVTYGADQFAYVWDLTKPPVAVP